jgi:cytochrome c oxidase cbb3-type subunit I/II
MPPYPWLLDDQLDVSTTEAKIRAMQTLGVPYPEGYDQIARADLEKQAKQVAENLAKDKIKIQADREIVALIAYLQRVGTDIKGEKKELAELK